ncbi:hypothetical protein HOC62_00655 [Candidatus Woesearchaeota archaeon]|nr:hypothetical protein [Candidatus Woesearchaeota archaeon]MBT4468880.1 hypothetical protein [Candidatus Woesearchaeota archaeon]
MGKAAAIGGALKSAGSKVTPGLTGAGAGATAVATQSAAKSFRNKGFPLFLAAVIIFIISQVLGLSDFYGYASVLFMVYCAYAVFEGRGAYIVTIFCVWYFLLGRASLESVLYYVVPIALIGSIIHGLLGKFKSKDTFAHGFTEEILYGLGAILIFFLDIGLVEMVSQGVVNLPYILTEILRLIPLWGYVGLFVMIQDEEKGEKSFFITVAKWLGIAYLVSIIIFASSIASGAEGEELLPGIEQFIEAKETAQGKFAKTENPAYSNLKCVVQGRFNDLPVCIKDRQDDSKRKVACEAEGFPEGTTSFNECTAELKELDNKNINVVGFNDKTIKEPITAELIPKEAKKYDLLHEKGQAIKIPIDLEIKNPRLDPFEVYVSCNITTQRRKTSIGEAEIVGFENKGENNEKGSKWKHFTIYKTESSIPLICQPTKLDYELNEETRIFNGSYNVVFYVEFKGVNTTSRLERSFFNDLKIYDEINKIKDLTSEQEQELRGKARKDFEEEMKEFLNLKYSSIESRHSTGPEDFARIDFSFGPSEGEPIIETSDSISFEADVDNLGNGKITNINSYNFIGFNGVTFSGSGCSLSGSLNVPQKFMKSSGIPIHLCWVDNLPEEMANPALGDETVEFRAELEYDYLIEREVGITAGVIDDKSK